MNEQHAYLCAWCKKEIHLGKTKSSHGICIKCFRAHFPAQLEYLRIHFPEQYAEFMEDERYEFEKNPSEFPALARVAHILSIFQYFYRAHEPSMNLRHRKQVLEEIKEAMRLVNDARAVASADEGQAEVLLNEADREIRKALNTLHGG